MRSTQILLVIAAFVATAQAYSFLIPANVRHPGICYYSGQQLQRGENYLQGKCEKLYCHEDGSILVEGCGQQGINEYRIFDRLNIGKQYPYCCRLNTQYNQYQQQDETQHQYYGQQGGYEHGISDGRKVDHSYDHYEGYHGLEGQYKYQKDIPSYYNKQTNGDYYNKLAYGEDGRVYKNPFYYNYYNAYQGQGVNYPYRSHLIKQGRDVSYKYEGKQGQGVSYPFYNYLGRQGQGVEYPFYNYLMRQGQGVQYPYYNYLERQGQGVEYPYYNYLERQGQGVEYPFYNYLARQGQGYSYPHYYMQQYRQYPLNYYGTY